MRSEDLQPIWSGVARAVPRHYMKKMPPDSHQATTRLTGASSPLQQATTTSLEALKNYSMGKELEKADLGASGPYYRRAVELDPNFARAYAALAMLYDGNGETDLARQNTKRAYELRDRCTEPEKLRIEAGYYMVFTGELEKANSV